MLFILRRGKWDLPKGKLKIGEKIRKCAIREVEEECGVDHLEIIRPLDITYHIYKRNEKTILKITYWFLMKTMFDGTLVPQIDEGITEAKFFKPSIIFPDANNSL